LQNEENPSTSQSSKPDISLDLSISSISNHLAAYVCRMDQVQELIPKDEAKNEFSEVYDVKFSRDLRLVTFTLKIVDGDATNEPAEIEEESNDELLLEIKLKYDADGRRPSEGGVKITIPNNQERYSKEDMEALHQQCGVFYSKTIAEGIRAAFLEREITLQISGTLDKSY